jgi:hypothetical protein
MWSTSGYYSSIKRNWRELGTLQRQRDAAWNTEQTENLFNMNE